MKKDKIVQFVGFITNLNFDEFVTAWDSFAKRFVKNHEDTILHQQSETKNRFKYVSQHEWAQQDFQFSFMEGRTSEYFPEHSVKVVQAGGYTPLQIEWKHQEDNGLVKVLAFISHRENDISFYSQISLHRYLNIYEAFYQSCTYAYILEFFVEEAQAPDLLRLLKTRASIETGVFKECLVTH